ncbi:MAG: hypothetical protein IPM56_07510 [Ignavibacteriales bacterium]|nr:MAG: hypothetical protein IPM56_07510 [Ignavibacteriales bacterium]
MSNEELITLLSIYLNPEFEDEESINENLKSAGIDAEQFQKDMMEKLEKLEAGNKLKDGKQFKEDFYRQLNESELSNAELEEIAFGFRDKKGNLTGGEEKELEEDKKKLALLKKINRSGENNNK